MRYIMVAVMILAAEIVTPALASKKQIASGPSWYDCYDLAWIRGVHVELWELPGFMDQCLAGTVPFGADFLKYYKRLPQ